MSRPFLFVTATLVWLVALAAPAARAQGTPLGPGRIMSVGLGGGVSFPVGHASDAFKQGFNGQGFLRLNLESFPIAPRLDVTFQRFDLKGFLPIGSEADPGPFRGVSGSLLALVGSVEIPLMRGPFEPYLVAGVGDYNFRTDPEGSSLKPYRTRFGFVGGAGMTVKLGVVSLYGEGRLDNVVTDQVIARDQLITVIPITLGLVY